MRKINYNREEIEQTIDRIVERTQRMDLMWDWPCGVAYYGIAEAYTATGKKLYIDFLKDRIDELINVGLPVWTVNTCAMGHSLLSLWQETGDRSIWKSFILRLIISGMRHLVLAIMCCSIPFHQIAISQNSVGQTRCLWLHFSCFVMG